MNYIRDKKSSKQSRREPGYFSGGRSLENVYYLSGKPEWARDKQSYFQRVQRYTERQKLNRGERKKPDTRYESIKRIIFDHMIRFLVPEQTGVLVEPEPKKLAFRRVNDQKKSSRKKKWLKKNLLFPSKNVHKQSTMFFRRKKAERKSR